MGFIMSPAFLIELVVFPSKVPTILGYQQRIVSRVRNELCKVHARMKEAGQRACPILKSSRFHRKAHVQFRPFGISAYGTMRRDGRSAVSGRTERSSNEDTVAGTSDNRPGGVCRGKRHPACAANAP
jgi:hypothetical protein